MADDLIGRVAVVDIEATGLHAAAVPIEIGWCLAPDGRAGNVLIHVARWLEGPASGWRWDKRAEALHEIDRERLMREGLDARSAAERVAATLDDRLALSDSPLDARWLALLLEEASWPRPWPALGDFTTVLNLATGSEEAARRLRAEAVARAGGTEHRAGADARMLWDLLGLAADRYGRAAVERALQAERDGRA